MTVKFSTSENKSRCMFAVYSELLFNKKYLTHIDTIAAYILNRFILQGILLFWFFGDFRCGALLFMVIHVIYKYKNK